MKKNLLIGALAVLTLSACSQDEMVQENRNDNEIAFSVVANKGSRAANLYCNSNLIGTFKAWAHLTTGGEYFKGLNYQNENGTWKTHEEVHYWPESDHLSFYAIAGTTANELTINSSASPFTATTVDYTVKENVKEQEDILYAATLDQGNPGGTVKTPLNFRHALSQIVFKGKNINKNLWVQVSEVRVANVRGRGTFTFSADTQDNWGIHNGTTDDTTDQNVYVTGKWNLVNNLYGYTATLDAVADLPGNSTVVNWTEPTHGAGANNAMLLMPTYSKPDADDATYPWAVGSTTGSFIAVKCCMYHVAGASYAATDVPVYGTTAQHKWIIIPASFKWLPGKKYVYTIVFGKDGSNGGFQPVDPDPTDPNPTPDPTDPKPVLTPITFEVEIDDFDLVLEEDKDADA